MIIVTTIYCAETEPAPQPENGKIAQRSLAELKDAELKDAERKLVSMYQGSSRVYPIDGER